MRPIQKIISDAGKHLGLSAAGQTKHLKDRPARRKPGRPASPYSLRPFSAVLHADEIAEIKAFAAQLQISTNEAARVIIREGLARAKQGRVRIKTAPALQKAVFG
jgi:hypothetical protein